MRICLVSEEFPPETGWGGIGTHTYNLSCALSDMGHSVDVVSKSVDGKEQISEKGSLRIHRITESADNSLILRKMEHAAPSLQKRRLMGRLTEFPLRSLRRGAAVSRWLKDQQPFDIIEAPDYGAEMFWSQFFNKSNTPVVVKLHTPLFLTQRLNAVPMDDLAVKLRKWMEKYSITHATGIISPTKSLAEIISGEFGMKNITVIPNCIDTDFFSYKEKPAGRKEKIFLYAGRLERRKGVEVLARAIPIVMREIPDARFHIIGHDTPTAEGGGSMKAWLEMFFEGVGVSDYVELPGGVPRTAIAAYYQQADVCVLPSLWENLPYTCLEAMACGTPVIGSRTGGFPEIISDSIDGFLFEPKDHEDLARKIIHVLNHTDPRELGLKAREKIVTIYGHKVIAEKTIEYYAKVLDA